MAETTLFQSQLSVITAGVGGFAEALRHQGIPVTDVDWRPPADGNAALSDILTAVYINPALHAEIEAANREVVRRITESTPLIVDIAPAGEAMGLEPRTIAHAGPPIRWDRMCGPQKRAVMGAIQFEGWAASNAEAAALVERDEVRLVPNHAYNAVGPMTGVISPSMPVLVARNETFGNHSGARPTRPAQRLRDRGAGPADGRRVPRPQRRLHGAAGQALDRAHAGGRGRARRRRRIRALRRWQ
jgi:hypothetical protein